MLGRVSSLPIWGWGRNKARICVLLREEPPLKVRVANVHPGQGETFPCISRWASPLWWEATVAVHYRNSPSLMWETEETWVIVTGPAPCCLSSYLLWCQRSRQVLLLVRCPLYRILAMWGHLVQCHFRWKNCLCLSFLVGPCINQHQIQWKYVVKLCKTLSRHTHFCLIIIQLRSVTDRVTLNQAKKKITWMRLPPSVNRSQWISSDNHSWMAQTSWNFISSFRLSQGSAAKGHARPRLGFKSIIPISRNCVNCMRQNYRWPHHYI